MGLVTCVNLFIGANVLLVLVAAVLAGIGTSSALLHYSLSYRQQLRLGQAVILAAVILPLACLVSGYRLIPTPSAQVWFAHTMHTREPLNTDGVLSGIIAVSPGESVPLERTTEIAGILFFAGLIYVVLRVSRDLIITTSFLTSAYRVRRRGRLHILASDRIQVPFSFWLPWRSIIVVPSTLPSRWGELRLVLRHEAQHHRQLDTMTLYLHAALKAVFFWNPAMHWLDLRVRALQEFACDEALRRTKRISCREYCECLLHVAEIAISQRRSSLVAGMAGHAPSNLLKRRIEVLLKPPAQPLHRSALMGIGMAIFILMAGTALAFSTAIQDRRISAEIAAEMAINARQDTSFPIAINEHVLRQLNLWLATPDGRVDLQDALRRMQSRAPELATQLARRHLPRELMAVPLVESGYRNLPQGGDPREGAGLWMMIKPTANRLGLRVDPNHDDRLDEHVETDVALRLLERLHRQFNDWELALLGYNVGGRRVQNAMQETASRSAWTLVDKGCENDPEYLARVMAAVLVMKNQSALN